jgi:hypothetical protein
MYSVAPGRSDDLHEHHCSYLRFQKRRASRASAVSGFIFGSPAAASRSGAFLFRILRRRRELEKTSKKDER